MKWLCLFFLLVPSFVGYGADPHQVFVAQLRQKFIDLRASGAAEPRDEALANAYLLYQSIEFVDRPRGATLRAVYDEDRYYWAMRSEELTKFFRSLSAKSTEDLYADYRYIVDYYLPDKDGNVESSKKNVERHIAEFEQSKQAAAMAIDELRQRHQIVEEERRRQLDEASRLEGGQQQQAEAERRQRMVERMGSEMAQKIEDEQRRMMPEHVRAQILFPQLVNEDYRREQMVERELHELRLQHQRVEERHRQQMDWMSERMMHENATIQWPDNMEAYGFLKLLRNRAGAFYFRKYSDDSFGVEDLDQVLKMIRFFGSFKMPLDDILEHYGFLLNGSFGDTDESIGSHESVYFFFQRNQFRRGEGSDNNQNFFGVDAQRWDIEGLILEAAREWNIWRYDGMRRRRIQDQTESYNMITHDLEARLLPVVAASITSGMQTEKKRSFLHYVTTMSDASMLQKLLSMPRIKSFLEHRDEGQSTPLLYSAEFGTYKNVELLVPVSNVREVNSEGENVLHLALRNYDHRVLLCLLRDISDEDLRHLLLEENDYGARPIEVFATKLEMSDGQLRDDRLSEMEAYEMGVEAVYALYRVGTPLNGAQLLLYYIPLMVKESELNIDASHRPLSGF